MGGWVAETHVTDIRAGVTLKMPIVGLSNPADCRLLSFAWDGPSISQLFVLAEMRRCCEARTVMASD